MKKKTILLFGITMVMFFALIRFDPSGNIELTNDFSVQAATIGTHTFHVDYTQAYVWDDHDGLFLGAGEWEFSLLMGDSSRTSEEISVDTEYGPQMVDMPTVFPSGSLLGISTQISDNTQFTCSASEYDSATGDRWLDYSSELVVDVAILEVTPTICPDWR